jgi:hypothetical protein
LIVNIEKENYIMRNVILTGLITLILALTGMAAKAGATEVAHALAEPTFIGSNLVTLGCFALAHYIHKKRESEEDK